MIKRAEVGPSFHPGKRRGSQTIGVYLSPDSVRPNSVAASSEDASFLSLSTFKRILLKKPEQRSSNSVQFLIDFTKAIKFFQDVVKEQGEFSHFQCCQYMSYEFILGKQVPNTQYLFHKGEPGSKFYILLDGICSVMIPSLLPNGEVEYHEVLEYSAGDSFGELALLRNAHRAASIYCQSDCHFAVLERDDFSRIVGRAKESRLAEKVEFLCKFPFFSRLSKPALQQISYYFRVKPFSLNQSVFKSGEPAGHIFFIRLGEFQLLEHIPCAKSCYSLRKVRSSTNRVGIALLTEGQLFGEDDILSGQAKRSYSAVCHSATGELFIISKEDFLRRVCSEDTLKSLKQLQTQKHAFRKKCIAGLTHLEMMKSTSGEWANADISEKEIRRMGSPALSVSSSMPQLSPLGKDLRQFSVGFHSVNVEQTGIRTEITASVDPIYERPLFSPLDCTDSYSPRIARLSWDTILRKQRSEKERKSHHKSSASKVINIHLSKVPKPSKVKRKLGFHRATNLYNSDSFPAQMITALDPVKIRFSERAIYEG